MRLSTKLQLMTLVIGGLTALAGLSLGYRQIKVGPIAIVFGSGKVDIKDESKQIIQNSPASPALPSATPLPESQAATAPTPTKSETEPTEALIDDEKKETRTVSKRRGTRRSGTTGYPYQYARQPNYQPYYPQPPTRLYSHRAVPRYPTVQPYRNYTTYTPRYSRPQYRTWSYNQPVTTRVVQNSSGQTIQVGNSVVIQNRQGQYVRTGNVEVIQTSRGQSIRTGNIVINQRD